MADSIGNQNLLAVYEQLCQSYRAIDDFRSKLLGFLPLASAGGAFLLLTDPKKIEAVKPFLNSLGLLGFVVTLGLFCYEIYGIRKCHALISAGRELECDLGIKNGQFCQRPRNLFYIINEPFAAGVIYPAVLAGWIFLASVFPQQQSDQQYAIESALATAKWVFCVGFLITLIYNLLLPIIDKVHKCN